MTIQETVDMLVDEILEEHQIPPLKEILKILNFLSHL